jgi:hypothetical protein
VIQLFNTLEKYGIKNIILLSIISKLSVVSYYDS